mmetsp:Transcript_179434/g.436592  ORF Transcript_179434/g.436592 Transcript_179434/m.436592 type:complete len:133 (-) Transcript_179434:121-519(-)
MASEGGKLRVIEVASPDDWKTTLAEHVGHGRLFALFTGAVSASTGKSWCPDCVRCDPVIKAKLGESTEETVLLECPVERMPYRSRDYPYRTDGLIRLTAVPTLLRIGKSGVVSGRAVEDECADDDLMDELCG